MSKLHAVLLVLIGSLLFHSSHTQAKWIWLFMKNRSASQETTSNNTQEITKETTIGSNHQCKDSTPSQYIMTTLGKIGLTAYLQAMVSGRTTKPHKHINSYFIDKKTFGLGRIDPW